MSSAVDERRPPTTCAFSLNHGHETVRWLPRHFGYLAYLFDHGDKPITCWDLYLAIRPEEKEKTGGPGWSIVWPVMPGRIAAQLFFRVRQPPCRDWRW